MALGLRLIRVRRAIVAVSIRKNTAKQEARTECALQQSCKYDGLLVKGNITNDVNTIACSNAERKKHGEKIEYIVLNIKIFLHRKTM